MWSRGVISGRIHSDLYLWLQELSNSVISNDEDCTSFTAVVAGHKVGIRDGVAWIHCCLKCFNYI